MAASPEAKGGKEGVRCPTDVMWSTLTIVNSGDIKIITIYLSIILYGCSVL